jgi:hypothetical protein
MLANKKEFTKGAVLMVAFLIVLTLIFMPIFGEGKNGLNYLDDLYNSISKGSAYYIPALKTKNAKMSGKNIMVSFAMKNEKQAAETAALLKQSGATVDVTGTEIKVSGDLGAMVSNCLEDSDMMFKNQGDKVRAKYGIDERQSMYNWWEAWKSMSKNLDKQKKFTETAFIAGINKRAVECAYNYYGVQSQNIADKWTLVTLSLAFYVVYTVWYGFAFLFMFEGWGLRLEH